MRRWQLQLFSPKRIVPVFLAGATGFIVLADLLQPRAPVASPGLQAIAAEILRWVVILTAFALLAGTLNVVGQHGRRLLRRDSGWLYSIALLAGLLSVLGVAITTQVVSPGSNPLLHSYVQSYFRYIYTPLSTSLLALLAFFGLSAALRALGSGRLEAIVLILIAILVLLLQLPIVSQIPALGETTAWIENYLALAGARGLILGGAIGALVASVRLLIGADRPYLDR